MRVVQETPNLFRLTRLGNINCFLVRETDGFTLIDTNLPGSAGAIQRAAVRLGSPIRRIAMTHAHIDHVGSLDALCASLPHVEFVIGQRESRLLRRDFTLDAGSYIDVRDNSLIAGDALVTQFGLVAAGVLRPFFPFAALFSWNRLLAVKSASRLQQLMPSLLASGHGSTLPSPAQALDAAVEEAFRQFPEAKES